METEQEHFLSIYEKIASINRDNFHSCGELLGIMKSEEVQRLLTVDYYPPWNKAGDTFCYHGTLMHHIVIDRRIKLENLPPIIAFLQFVCSLDGFYHHYDSNGNAPCYLAAWRAREYPLFYETQKYLKILTGEKC